MKIVSNSMLPLETNIYLDFIKANSKLLLKSASEWKGWKKSGLLKEGYTEDGFIKAD